MDNHVPEFIMILLSKFQVAITAFLASLVTLIFIVLDESMMLITVAYAMLILNIISGWLLMWKRREKWNSDKWFKMCMKFLWFGVLILVTKSLKIAYQMEISIGVFIAGFLTINEFKSVIENSGRLMGIDIWNAIADYVDWDKLFKGIKKDRKENAE
jgi:amino acid transporter